MSGDYDRLINGEFPERSRVVSVNKMILSKGPQGEKELQRALVADYLKDLSTLSEDPSKTLEKATRIVGSIMLAREAVMDGTGSSTIYGEGYTVYCEGIEEAETK